MRGKQPIFHSFSFVFLTWNYQNSAREKGLDKEKMKLGMKGYVNGKRDN
ncbi:hypothetical protein LEP1GSC060_2261 [Leptospira weilii serovar Ranarum str. ICFT]|uniref:Uncharacterized protein n=1 Tax=Leptospira weilii serovar Ranarum str. ICFT TaxID=1218598 RepID=N1WJP2_9LEPT|nr:hypothetical protein LEP1GSC060_2261 [Leptospira weilii serovar Ranarum str. ICFT]